MLADSSSSVAAVAVNQNSVADEELLSTGETRSSSSPPTSRRVPGIAKSKSGSVSHLPWGASKDKPFSAHNFNSSLQTGLPAATTSNFLNVCNRLDEIQKRKPGEYIVHLVLFNFVHASAKKLEQITLEKRDKRLKECFLKNEDSQFDKLVTTLGHVAEQCLPSLTHALLTWHDSQLTNLAYLKHHNQLQHASQQEHLAASSSNLKANLKDKKQNIQAKLENDFIDERREMVIHCLLCIPLIEILKQLSFHPGNDELLHTVIELCFRRFLAKEVPGHHSSLGTNAASASINAHQANLFADNQYVTDLYAEIIGCVAQHRFSLVRRRFVTEFNKLKLNISSIPTSTSSSSSTSASATTGQSQTSVNATLSDSETGTNGHHHHPHHHSSSSSQTSGSSQNLASISTTNTLTATISPTSANIIKLLMGMKHFRIKMVPIEDFEASFHFLNDCAQYFCEVKDKDIKHTLAGLFVEILVPITGQVKNEVNIPCLKLFVDILYTHALELSAKSKHRLATIPLLTCLLCVSQRQFFLNSWFQFAQLCIQQFKSREPMLARISLEAILRLIWVYMVRIKGEKSSETNQRLLTIVQNLFPKGSKVCNPKEMPSNIFVKIVGYIAHEKLDFAMKEIIYDLLSIENSSLYAGGSSGNNNSGNNLSSMNAITTGEQMTASGQLSVSTQGAGAGIGQSGTTSGGGLLATVSSISGSSVAYRTSKDNLVLQPVKMDIGLRAFVLIADRLQQQKELGPAAQGPSLPQTFSIPSQEPLSVYLNYGVYSSSSSSKTRSSSIVETTGNNNAASGHSLSTSIILTDALAREIGLGSYFEHVRRAYQDILKTLDATIGRTFLLTRPENTQSVSSDVLDSSVGTNSGSTAPHSGDLSGAVPSNGVNGSMTSGAGSSVGGGSSSAVINESSDHLMLYNADNKPRLVLMRTCIALIPRMMPLFKEYELIDIVTRLTLHMDDELKFLAFNVLKTLVTDFPQWRKFVFMGFTSLIIRELGEMAHAKLIEQSLKMLIQLLNAWKSSVSANNNQSSTKMLLDDACQTIFHLEGFAIVCLCHSQVQRRRFALILLRECKQIGEETRCFKRLYAHGAHSYALDVLDAASAQTMRRMHLQCFSSPLMLHVKPDLQYLIEQSAMWSENSVNTANYNSHTLNGDTFPNSSVSNLSNSAAPSNNLVMMHSSTVLNPIHSAGLPSHASGIGGNNKLRTSSLSAAYNSTSNHLGSSLLAGQLGISTSSNLIDQIGNEQKQVCSENPLGGSTPSSTLSSQGPVNENDSTNNASSLPLAPTPVPTAPIPPLRASTIQPTPSHMIPQGAMFTFDPWHECISILLSHEFILTKCPIARLEAWPLLHLRLQQLLPSVDPNEHPAHETTTSRASLLFGVGATSLEKMRRAASERDAALNIWKNYLLAACCIMPGSDRHVYAREYERAMTRMSDEENSIAQQQNQAAVTISIPAGQNLMRLIVPYLKCDCNYFRECCIRALGKVNVEVIRDLWEELTPYIKECVLSDNTKQQRGEKVRRVKKKDLLRLAIVRIVEISAEQSTLGKRLVDAKRAIQQQQQTTAPFSSQLEKIFSDYIDGMSIFLDQTPVISSNTGASGLSMSSSGSTLAGSSSSSLIGGGVSGSGLSGVVSTEVDLIIQTRLHFSLLIHKLIDSVPKERRATLLKDNVKYTLFYMCDKWSGRFSLNQHSVSSPASTLSHQNETQKSTFLSSRMSTSASNQQQNLQAGMSQRSNPNQLYMHQSHYPHFSCYHYYEELELAACRACASLLYCGSTTFKYMSSKNANVFSWLVQLLECAAVEMRMYESCKYVLPNEIYLLASQTFTLLLDGQLTSILTNQSRAQLTSGSSLTSFDSTNNPLFDLIIDKCYASSESATSDLCYMTLARVYTDYLNANNETQNNSFDSLYKNSILTLCLLNIGSSRMNIHETSILLLKAINKKFLSSEDPLPDKSPEDQGDGQPQSAPSRPSRQTSLNPNQSDLDTDIINSLVVYSKSQMYIVEYLARKNPELTMSLFLEMTSRFEKCASYQLRRSILNCLLPWMYNMQLVDPNVSEVESNSYPAFGSSYSYQYRGSAETTQLILNNLFYLTCKFGGSEFNTELEVLWAVLALSWQPNNLKIIIRFLYIMCSVSISPYEMITHAKRIVTYLAKACTQRVIDEVIAELEYMDALSVILERVENRLPFYSYTRPAYVVTGATLPSEGSQNNKKKSIYEQFGLSDEDDESDESDDSDEDSEEDDSDSDSVKKKKKGKKTSGSENSDSSSDDSDQAESGKEDGYDLEQRSGKDGKKSSVEDLLSAAIQTGPSETELNNIQVESINYLPTNSSFPILPLPSNYQSFICRLNTLLYHTGHHHNQYHNQYSTSSHLSSHHSSPIHSYLNNYSHHIHYQHVAHLTRSHISLILLSELVGTDGADYDWTTYMPLILHYCLINFDNPKQLVCEHAKKLLLSLLYVICVQNELHSLAEYLLEYSTNNVIDNQSVVFNRVYTNNNVSSTLTSSVVTGAGSMANNLARFNPNACHYNYYFNPNRATTQNQLLTSMSVNSMATTNPIVNSISIDTNEGSQKAGLPFIQSAPASPASSVPQTSSVQNGPVANSSSLSAPSKNLLSVNNPMNKKENKLDKAKDHLKSIMLILAKSKCSPVWPHEYVSSQHVVGTHKNSAGVGLASTSPSKMISIQLINEFVSQLRSFLKICSSTKKVSTISSSSTRSFSLGLSSAMSGANVLNTATQWNVMVNVDKIWAQYALITAIKSTHYAFNRHYATRSLQISRALGVHLGSLSSSSQQSTVSMLIHRLAETVCEPSEEMQSYVIEILLTIKLNANLLAAEYTQALNNAGGELAAPHKANLSDIKSGKSSLEKLKQKSKSLQFQNSVNNKVENVKQSAVVALLPSSTVNEIDNNEESHRVKRLMSRKRSATANFAVKSNASEQSKSNKKSNSLGSQSSNSHKKPLTTFTTSYKHQIAYRKSFTLNLFESKWNLLQDKSCQATLNNRHVTHRPKSIIDLRHLLKEAGKQHHSHQQAGNVGQDALRSLVHSMWTAICLLESDFEHEFVLAIEIIETILTKCDLIGSSGNSTTGGQQLLVHHRNELRTTLELFAFRIVWPAYPGLQNLLLKGCVATQALTVESTQRLLVQLIPLCARLNFVDPDEDPIDGAASSGGHESSLGRKYCGLTGLALNLISMLPAMLLCYDKPSEICIAAAEAHCKALRDQIRLLEEQHQLKLAKLQQLATKQPSPPPNHIAKSNKIDHLKNLVHILNMFSQHSFGKDKQQWLKCVIAYLSEFFQQCELENPTLHKPTNSGSSTTSYYFPWILFLTELLERNHNQTHQACVLACLQSLLNYVDLGDSSAWAFINDELMRIVVKFINTPLYPDALDLIKLSVSKSSSLITTTKPSYNSSATQPKTTPITMHNFFPRRELPGRTLEFDFDFGIFSANKIQSGQNSTQPAMNNNPNEKILLSKQILANNPPPYLGLVNVHQSDLFHMLYQYMNSTSVHHAGMNNHHPQGGWKKPMLSKPRTRERFSSLLTAINKYNYGQQQQASASSGSAVVSVITNSATNKQGNLVSMINKNNVIYEESTSQLMRSTGFISSDMNLSNNDSYSTNSATSSAVVSPALKRPEPSSSSALNMTSSPEADKSSTSSVSLNSTSIMTPQQIAHNTNQSTPSPSSSSLNSVNNKLTNTNNTPTSSSNNSSSLNQTGSFITSPDQGSKSPRLPGGNLVNSLIQNFNHATGLGGSSSNVSQLESKLVPPMVLKQDIHHHIRKNSMSLIKGPGGGIVTIVNGGSTNLNLPISSLIINNNTPHNSSSGVNSAVSSGSGNVNTSQSNLTTAIRQHQHSKSNSSISKMSSGGNSVDLENNFINNTFSFLDDLDQDNSDFTLFNHGTSKSNVFSIDTSNATTHSTLTSSDMAERTLGKDSLDNNESTVASNDDKGKSTLNLNNDYENFPWNSIYPAQDGGSMTADSSSQLNLSSRSQLSESNLNKLKANDSNKLSSSFSSSANPQMSNAFQQAASSQISPNGQILVSHFKNKPIAPRVKFPATLGAASGAEVLKQIHTFESNKIGTGAVTNVSSSSSQMIHPDGNQNSSLRNSVASVNSSSSSTSNINVMSMKREFEALINGGKSSNPTKNETTGGSTSSISSTATNNSINEHRQSVTRIARSDSLQNINNRLLRSLASNNSQSNNNSSLKNASNSNLSPSNNNSLLVNAATVIYDHRTSSSELTSPKSSLTHNSSQHTKQLATKSSNTQQQQVQGNSKLRVYSVNNLASLQHTDSSPPSYSTRTKSITHSNSSSNLSVVKDTTSSVENSIRTSINSIYMASAPLLKLINLPERDLIDAWTDHCLHMSQVATQSPDVIKLNVNVIKSFYLARGLLRAASAQFATLIDKLRERLRQHDDHSIQICLGNLANKLNTEQLVPLVFVDQRTLRANLSGEFFKAHIRLVNQVAEHFDLFVQAEPTLSQALDGHQRDDISEIVKHASKLTERFVNCLQCLSNLYLNLSTSILESNVKNCTHEISKLKSGLMNALNQFANSNVQINPETLLPAHNDSPFRSESIEYYIYLVLDCLKQEHFLLTAQYLKLAQTKWPGEFKTLDAVLLLAFEQLKLNYPDCVALIKCEPEIDQVVESIKLEHSHLISLIAAGKSTKDEIEC